MKNFLYDRLVILFAYDHINPLFFHPINYNLIP
jgi:hypothetical protein